MIETVGMIGIAAVLIPIVIYNARKISRIEDKVNLIYNNINMKIAWKTDNPGEKDEERHDLEDKEI